MHTLGEFEVNVTGRSLGEAVATDSVCVPAPSTIVAGWSKVMVCGAFPDVVKERMLPVRIPSASEPALVVPATRK